MLLPIGYEKGTKLVTTEEVTIRLGLDNAALRSGLAGSDFLVQNSIKATMNSLKNLVRINMVTMALEVAKAWDKVSDVIAKSAYNLEGLARTGGFLEQQRLALRKEREAAEKVRETEAKLAKERKKYSEDLQVAQMEYRHELEKNAELQKKISNPSADVGEDKMRLRQLQNEQDLLKKRIAEARIGQANGTNDVLKAVKLELELQAKVTEQLEIQARLSKEKADQALQLNTPRTPQERRRHFGDSVNATLDDLAKFNNAEANAKAQDILTPGNPFVKNQRAAFDRLNAARSNYFKGISDRTKNPALKDMYGDLAKSLNPKIQGPNADPINKMLEYLQRLTDAATKDGIRLKDLIKD